MANNETLFALCDKSIKENKLKLAFAAGMMVCSVLLSFVVFGLPAVTLFSSGSINVLTIVIALLSLISMYVFLCVLFYGFFVLVTRLYKGDFVTLGFLFYGFKDLRRTIRLGLCFALVMILVSIIFSIPIIYVQIQDSTFFDQLAASYGYILLSILSLGVTITVVSIIFPYIFAFFSLHDTQGKTVDAAVLPHLKQSRIDMKGKKLILFVTCLSYSKIEVLCLFLSFVIPLLLGLVFQDGNRLAGIIASFCSYAFYISFYLVLVKSITVISALYYGSQRIAIESTESE